MVMDDCQGLIYIFGKFFRWINDSWDEKSNMLIVAQLLSEIWTFFYKTYME